MVRSNEAMRVAGLAVFTFLAASAVAKEKSDVAATVRDSTPLVRLVRAGAVQAELGLNRKQRAMIEALVAEVDYPLFLLRDQPIAAKRDKLEAIAVKIQEELHRVLTDSQRLRLRELLVRYQGWPAVLTPSYVEEIGLSKEQVARIQKILSEEKSQKGKKTASLDSRILKLLDDDQKSAVNRIIGKPFDLRKVPQAACPAPELRDVTDWINTEPLTLESLRGRVVALHFYAFGCGNCVNNEPHYKAWHERYANKKVTVLGIHTPETARERDSVNVKADASAKQLAYPIAVDSKSANWAAWANNMWPSTYLIDKKGIVRYWWYGELNWQGAKGEELMRGYIEDLLKE